MNNLIEDLEYYIISINHKFYRDFVKMDLFFLYNNRALGTRTVLSVLRSVPGLRLSVKDYIGPDIAFESTWSNKVSKYEKTQGWDSVEIGPKKNHSYLAQSFTSCQSVRELGIYEWGFQLMSSSNMDIVGIISTYLVNSKSTYIKDLVGKEITELPLKDTFDPKHKWVHPKREKKEPQFGQTNKKLLIDEYI